MWREGGARWPYVPLLMLATLMLGCHFALPAQTHLQAANVRNNTQLRSVARVQANTDDEGDEEIERSVSEGERAATRLDESYSTVSAAQVSLAYLE
jgi:hypothetical protein